MRNCAVSSEIEPKRLYPEESKADRPIFLQDGDRVVHTTAFRRLTDKTQVWIDANRDHYRTRLTHTIEVSRAAYSIAQNLGLNAELTEVIALTHDLGHPPFGHMGEVILDDLLKDEGGFNHNAQAIQIVTYLSSPNFSYKGLNLTWFSLEGIAKHNGPITKNIPFIISEYNKIHDLKLDMYPSAEAQVASLSDDIVYNCHDLQDGMRSGKLQLEEIIDCLPLIKEQFDRIKQNNQDVDRHRLKANIIKSTFGWFVKDITKCAKKILDQNEFNSDDEVREFAKPVIEFTEEGKKRLGEIRKYLRENLYKLELFEEKKGKVQRLITSMFDFYMEDTNRLPENWQKRIEEERFTKKRLVGDYIAGMTDRYTIRTALNQEIVQEKYVLEIM